LWINFPIMPRKTKDAKASPALPQFKYHPDPIRSGSIVPSNKKCDICGQAREFIYDGPVYCEDEPDAVCPWCIADGSAHQKLDAEFVDRAAIGGDDWESISPTIEEEVAFRTPGFSGWQEQRWFTHCSDAAEFIGPMGKEELREAGADAVEAIREECGIDDDDEWEEFFDSLSVGEGPATAYLFRCRHCGKFGGYSDSE